ncbi:endoribonuclease L-PSP (plasmid) [Cupriavidus necator N-1]|uniref:Endoribonuclease L-PSP n=1 Tax=Cupriavidus necator (strain ATCC 43291 / DSM 13513 / CCUG 52238 / LMG 8453 / N-1) TaxID=1042878 RepID=F8GUJ8_CUPNN|nr:RidA family protein [Cupriavidus necator]AEI82402.1 endoribonuclease L-PSP [Cupriavidus necator N-1]MDX6007413.1 RidA family protein [Cupriavidus necator]
MHPEARLAAVGLSLPSPIPPSEHYVPFRIAGNVLYVSGHGPRRPDGSYVIGCLSAGEDVAMGYEAARQVALQMLATVKLALGDLDRVESVLKALGMVHATPDFTLHPKVINGFSEVLTTAFGDAGRHARSAVGMASLPHGMVVEVEAIFLVRDGSA